MEWEFRVVARKERKLLSRILQTIENQMMTVHSFTGDADREEDLIYVTFVVSSEENKAYRIEALLHRLEKVLTVTVATRIPVLDSH